MSASSHVPHDLRRFVVEQDYAQYNEVDQAVWRFVLLQTYERLQHTAHLAYRNGLAQTGISVERIPRIAQMSACLEAFGWHAVCVDGFIPPRAFQAFQAASILPIAADMRSKEHLTYTPAPDIIHEAAGHAPILPDPHYAAYLRAIGEVGKKAFSSPGDARVDAAIFELSELKEVRGVQPELVRAAEAKLEHAIAQLGVASEASRLSRLYWWTAEYGLVGRPDDYRLYGAGLLSSLWESHACHARAVRKLPLSASCVEQSYDITRPQPQLYVARDFQHLFEVLNEVDASLVYRRGGQAALEAALHSDELATLHFDRDRLLIGELTGLVGSAREGLLTFRGSVGLGAAGRVQELIRAERDYRVPLGRLKDGRELESLGSPGQRLKLEFASGVCLEGELQAAEHDRQGRLFCARFSDYRLSSARANFCEQGLEYVLFVAPDFVTAHAGASDAQFFPVSEPSPVRVPKPRTFESREQELLALYERACAVAHEQLGGRARVELAAIHERLSRSFPDEWLLRWNLLEALCRLGQRDPLSDTLESELLALELRFHEREPIASGLRYLARLAA